MFTKPGGGAYHPQYLSRMLGRFTAELDLPRLTAHGLRHTCATLILANGVAPKVAAERLGHADATLFTNLYSHVTPTMQRDAASRIGNALFGLPSAGAQANRMYGLASVRVWGRHGWQERAVLPTTEPPLHTPSESSGLARAPAGPDARTALQPHRPPP